MNNIGVAVIGAGILGKRHARVWDELEGTRLVAVADLNTERAKEAAGSSGAYATEDANVVLDDDSVDAVSIALPDHLHHDLAVAALRKGKHVLVEKPLATTEADARSMVAAAAEAGRVLQVNFSQRWLSDYAYIKQVLDAGEIGTIQSIVSTKRDTIFVPTKMIPWAAKTSPVFFMTSHDLDLIRWYTGSEPASVSAVEHDGVLRSLGVPVHDGVDAFVELANGVKVTFSTSWTHPTTYPMVAEDRLEIIGSTGVIDYRSRNRELSVYSATGARTITFTGPATATEKEGKIVGAFTDSFTHFVDSIATGSVPTTAGTDSLPAVACQEAMLRSAANNGTRITLPTD